MTASLILFFEFGFSFFFFRYYLFTNRGKGRERGRETSMCGCLSCAPYWGPGLQPRHVPWPGIELATPWSAVQHWIHWASPTTAGFSFLDSEYKWYHNSIYLSLSDLLSIMLSSSIHIIANGIISLFFHGWIIFHCIYMPQLLYPLIHGRRFRLFPCIGCCK